MVDLGVFLPVLNNGWIVSTTAPQYYPLPFVSAGMGFVAVPELVAAVSNAGGLGLLGASPAPPPAIQAMIQATKSLT